MKVKKTRMPPPRSRSAGDNGRGAGEAAVSGCGVVGVMYGPRLAIRAMRRILFHQEKKNVNIL
jgi:hypothetical protein